MSVSTLGKATDVNEMGNASLIFGLMQKAVEKPHSAFSRFWTFLKYGAV